MSEKSKIQKLNEELQPINEMAKLTGGIVVHNENDNSENIDQLKFAHFHWKGVHFKLSRHIPQNVSELRKMIAFPSKENFKLSDFELTELVNILKSKPVKPRKNSFRTVYQQIIEMWETLNERDVDYID